MNRKMTRRRFAKIAGTGALASTATTGLSAVASEPSTVLQPTATGVNSQATGREFPKGFIWGTATASYQVEGAFNEDGRGTIDLGHLRENSGQGGEQCERRRRR